MTVPERVQETRAICEKALHSWPLSDANERIARAGLSPGQCSELLRSGARRKEPAAEFAVLYHSLPEAKRLPDFAFERALLLRSAVAALDAIPSLPVDESVMHLFCREFVSYAAPRPASLEDFAFFGRRFAAMSGIVSLARFPAGQYHWVVSGFPRRLLAKARPRELPALCRFFAKTHGFAPFFEPHLNGTTSRSSFLTEREYLKSFYRMAAALEKQPSVKGIMAFSWLYSCETHRVSPHLAFLNLPYMEAGGLYAELGAAEPDGGFLLQSPGRAEMYRAGRYKPTNALVVCTRAQAIAWKEAHPELETMLHVR